MNRRDFMGFFLIGGLVSGLMRKFINPFVKKDNTPLRRAMFWKNVKGK